MKSTDYCPQCLCMDCAKERHRRRGKLARSAALLALAVAMAGCATCETFYRHDSTSLDRPYYRLDVCKNRDGTTSTTLVCDSPNRLPNSGCK